MNILTAHNPMRVTHTTLSTASAFGAYNAAGRIPTATTPSVGSGKIPCSGNLALTQFYGTAAANGTGQARLWGWHKAVGLGGSVLWVPVLLETLIDFTLGASVGVSGYLPSNSHFLADTITKTTGRSASEVIGSNSSDFPAGFLCDCLGFDWIEWELIVATATSVGAVTRFL